MEEHFSLISTAACLLICYLLLRRYRVRQMAQRMTKEQRMLMLEAREALGGHRVEELELAGDIVDATEFARNPLLAPIDVNSIDRPEIKAWHGKCGYFQV